MDTPRFASALSVEKDSTAAERTAIEALLAGLDGARPDIVALAHAVLIGYPRYFDPILGTACPPEVVVERLASGAPLPGRPHPIARIGQRIFAGLWHR